MPRLAIPIALTFCLLLPACIVPVPLPGPMVSMQVEPEPIPPARMLAEGACTVPADARYNRPIEMGAPDTRLAADAIRRHVNAVRCRHGLAPLGLTEEAMQAARLQTAAMVRYDFMGHTSPVAGQRTLHDRLKRSGRPRFRTAGENVARTPVTVTEGARHRLASSGRCRFRRDGMRRPVGLTYDMLAERLVAMWMQSPKHRANMLSGRFDLMGADIGFRPDKGRCGEAAGTAVFLG